MPTSADIVNFMATDFPQSNGIIEATGDRGISISCVNLLVTGDVNLYSEGDECPVAHVVGTITVN